MRNLLTSLRPPTPRSKWPGCAQDLTFAVLDIGQDSHPCVAAWRMGAEAALARKIILGPQQEMAIMTYGSDHTNHDLINDASASQYVGINVITVRSRPPRPADCPMRIQRHCGPVYVPDRH